MKNKGIIIFLIVLSLVIIAVLVGDFLGKRPDRMAPNKFEFTVDAFKDVPEEQILYRETKNFKVGFEKPAGLNVKDGLIYLVGDKSCMVINEKGERLHQINLDDNPTRVIAEESKVYIIFKNKYAVYDSKLNLLKEVMVDSGESYLTDLTVSGKDIFIADAGARKIYRHNIEGTLINTIEGKAEERAVHGFIIPSPYFDLEINPYGDLWVVNPGLHTLENYTPEGKLREHWKASGAQTENFSGCCNPAHFCFLPDGSFVTSEKGLVRIKVYKPSGEFLGVVAPPKVFEDKIEGQAPDVDSDDQGNIYALDLDRKVLRVFEKN